MYKLLIQWNHNDVLFSVAECENIYRSIMKVYCNMLIDMGLYQKYIC